MDDAKIVGWMDHLYTFPPRSTEKIKWGKIQEKIEGLLAHCKCSLGTSRNWSYHSATSKSSVSAPGSSPSPLALLLHWHTAHAQLCSHHPWASPHLRPLLAPSTCLQTLDAFPNYFFCHPGCRLRYLCWIPPSPPLLSANDSPGTLDPVQWVPKYSGHISHLASSSPFSFFILKHGIYSKRVLLIDVQIIFIRPHLWNHYSW